MFTASNKYPDQYNVESYSLLEVDPTPSQRKAIGALIRAALNYEAGVLGTIDLWKVTHIKLSRMDSGSISLSFEVERTDCDEYSPLNAVCRGHFHFFVGKRGSVQFCNGSKGNVPLSSGADFYKTQN